MTGVEQFVFAFIGFFAQRAITCHIGVTSGALANQQFTLLDHRGFIVAPQHGFKALVVITTTRVACVVGGDGAA